MGTEVLIPHDHFNTSPTPLFHRQRRVNLISADRGNKKAKKSKKSSNLSCKDDVIKVKKLVNGHVTLLKRGDVLGSIVTKSIPIDKDIAISNGKRIGPKQIRLPALNTYAGSVVMTSPSPRALPQPSFFTRKRENGELVLDDFATKDLRRLLRLE